MDTEIHENLLILTKNSDTDLMNKIRSCSVLILPGTVAPGSNLLTSHCKIVAYALKLSKLP